MPLYNFTLTLPGVKYETKGLEDSLFESGCDDGMIGACGDSVYIEFDREADSLKEAIASAVENISSCGFQVIANKNQESV